MLALGQNYCVKIISDKSNSLAMFLQWPCFYCAGSCCCGYVLARDTEIDGHVRATFSLKYRNPE